MIGNGIKFINVVGIDGSGKTTLCKKLLHEFRKRYPDTQYVHSYHEPFFLKPLKTMARSIFMRGTDEFANYSHYKERKASASRKHRWLSQIYGLMWVFDYTIQAFYKVGMPILMGRRLLLDRYIFDTMLNVSLTSNINPESTYRALNILFRILPRPDVVLLIDLPEDVAFNRKDDIQGIEYLRERRKRYLSLARKYNFKIINGLDNQEKILKETLNILEQNESK